MNALKSKADIVIGGGAAGVGKTWCILMESIRNIENPNFGAVFFRRTSPMISAEGGLWDASMKLFPLIKGALPRESFFEWRFPSGAKIKFSHLEYEKNLNAWMGSEIPLIVFDELTHFSKKMFFYMLSRNRSTCGVKPYIRATCNPDPDSWVADFISYWIGEDGFPDPAKKGHIRYFMVDSDQYIWGDSYEEVIEKGWHVLEEMVERSGKDPKTFIKSLEFVSGSIYDNKALLDVDPGYLGNLNAQAEDDKQALLHGNWKVKPSDLDIYNYDKFNDIFTNQYVEQGDKYITADIALKGSDKFVVLVWSGMVVIDIVIMDKSDGKEVITAIKSMANLHGVTHSNILFDNDGVGGFVDGFIVGAKEFMNGGTPMDGEMYKNLKTQCYYKSGQSVNLGLVYILPEVAARRYDDKHTVGDRLVLERKAIKRDKSENDGKLCIIDKAKMKVFLNGQSPDLLDAFMMREYFEYIPKFYVG